ncbi:MAG: hypothetical protein ABJZ55_16065 [Fuerstiella sp.]
MAFTMSDVILDANAPSERTIHQITNISHSQNAELVNAVATGAASPAAFFIGNTSPVTQVTSTDSTLLTLSSNLWLSRGYCAEAGIADLNHATVVPFNERANCAVFNAANVHAAFGGRHTMVVPTSMSGTRAEAIEFQLDLRYLSLDPFLPPNTILNAQALSASSFAQASQFAGAYIGGVEIAEAIGFTYTPNFTILAEPVQGGNYPTVGYISEVSAQVEIQTENLNESLAVLNGVDLGAGLTIYLATKKVGAVIEPKTSPVHASITALNGIRQTSQITSQQGQNGQGTIQINLASPSGGDAVTVATGITLP